MFFSIYLFALLQVHVSIDSLTYKTSLFIVKGNVEQIDQYCLGARPSKSIFNESSKRRPYPSRTFYVVKGDSNFTNNSEIIETFLTNSNGDFSLKLPKGIFSIFLDEQISPLELDEYQNGNYNIDKDCIDKWKGKPYYTFEITDHNPDTLKFTFVNRCFLKTHIPCITYSGAMKH